MSDQPAQESPVIGDGVVTISVPVEESKCKMPIELGQTASELLMAESIGNIQASNRNSRNASDVVMGALQGTVVQNFKDVGVVEGRSVSGILATPIAGPATGQK